MSAEYMQKYLQKLVFQNRNIDNIPHIFFIIFDYFCNKTTNIVMNINPGTTIPKFMQIYFNFTSSEARNFEKLSVTSYFYKKRNYKPILKCLSKLKKSKQQGNKLVEIVLEETGLNRRSLSNRFSELTRIAEYFFILNKLNKNDMLRENLFLESIEQSGHKELAYYHISPALKMISRPEFSDDSFLIKHRIIDSLSKYYSDINNYSEFARLNIIQSEYSAMHFLLLMFRQLVDILLQEKNNVKHGFKLAEEIAAKLDLEYLIGIIRKHFPLTAAPLEIYFHLFRSFKEPGNEIHFYEARDLLMKNSTRLAKSFKNEIYQILRNYCIDKTNEGNSKYYVEIFHLNNQILKEGLFKDLNVVNSQTNNFRNFIFAASRLNKFDWIKNFIRDYSRELPEEMRDDEVNLSKGILGIYEKKYVTALEFLNKVNRKRYLHYLDTSIYRMMIFYETAEFEECYKELARQKDYLRKHKEIPSYLKESYQRFNQKFLWLIKITEKNDENELEIYLNEMHKLRYVGMGGWLYEKALGLNNITAGHNI